MSVAKRKLIGLAVTLIVISALTTVMTSASDDDGGGDVWAITVRQGQSIQTGRPPIASVSHRESLLYLRRPGAKRLSSCHDHKTREESTSNCTGSHAGIVRKWYGGFKD